MASARLVLYLGMGRDAAKAESAIRAHGDGMSSESPDARAKDARDDVTASEIACYAFCAKAWHLEHVLHAGTSSEARTRRDEGIRNHLIDGRSIRLQKQFPRRRRLVIGLLFLIALIAGVAALLV